MVENWNATIGYIPAPPAAPVLSAFDGYVPSVKRRVRQHFGTVVVICLPALPAYKDVLSNGSKGCLKNRSASGTRSRCLAARASPARRVDRVRPGLIPPD